jgi:diguanylate cyclase (GGDEF)-like protein
MSAATFVLAINLCIAGIFATAFAVIGIYARSAIAARWMALGYAVGMLNPLLEFFLPVQVDPRPVQMGIFLSMLVALALCSVGISRHYRLPPPWRTLCAIVAASFVINILTLDMPRDSLLRGMLYQTPYLLVQLVSVVTIMRCRHRQPLDTVLMVMFATSGLQFVAKPVLAALLGSGPTPQAYIDSTYAAISQSIGAVLLIASGLLMLLIIVRDAMAEMAARSETDKLSGLFNRRGFEDQANRQLALTLRAGVPGSMVVADLDHFKTINDTFGHEAGDRVIRAFAEVLSTTTSERAVIGRLGGEEFAVFIAGANLVTARLYAETVRSGFSSLSIASLRTDRRVSASFGVAELCTGDSLSDLMRRADAALYEAKKGGRDRVCIATTMMAAGRPAPADEHRRSARRPD